MAVDTRAKRASLLGLALPINMHLPIPTGTIGQATRQALTWLYSGILAAPPATASFIRRNKLRLLYTLRFKGAGQ